MLADDRIEARFRCDRAAMDSIAEKQVRRNHRMKLRSTKALLGAAAAVALALTTVDAHAQNAAPAPAQGGSFIVASQVVSDTVTAPSSYVGDLESATDLAAHTMSSGCASGNCSGDAAKNVPAIAHPYMIRRTVKATFAYHPPIHRPAIPNRFSPRGLSIDRALPVADQRRSLARQRFPNPVASRSHLRA